MTISRRIGAGYAVMSTAAILMLAWLWRHEFVEEPREFAAMGLPGIHKDTAAEMMTVAFLAAMPILLGLGWWWTRRALQPLQTLAKAAAEIESTNLKLKLPATGRNDEIETLTSVLVAMAARLESSFQEIREFTLHASHELKTPLTVMRAELETVQRERGSASAEEREWVGSLLDEVIRLADVVDSLTLLAKADAGILPFEKASVDLGAVAREAFEDALVMAEAKRVTVTLAIGKGIGPTILGDRRRLRQLLLILIDNAVKYNREGGTIAMAATEKRGFAELQITNTGGAISAETQQRAFQRFARGENAASRAEGCGLGLSIAKSIVEAHGGTITVEPASAEETVVTVQLPGVGASAQIS